MPRKASAKKRQTLFVGVDYGTTYSGVSYVFSSDTKGANINIITNWPSGLNNTTLQKVPSMIAYNSENKHVLRDHWGYEVKAGMQSYTWTKLLFDKATSTSEFDDPKLYGAAGKGLLKLPSETKLSKEILAVTPIEFWFTYPAIWSDQAQAKTRTAAVLAGFTIRELDTIDLISEPEAAALFVIHQNTFQKLPEIIKPKTSFIVCDAGGGTVDLTTYAAHKENRKTVFRETCVGGGGKCGATYLDRNLHLLLSERFGNAFDSLSEEKKAHGSKFMREFESVKRDYRHSGAKSYTLPLRMDNISQSSYYDKDENEIIITSHDLYTIFEPVVERVIGLLKQQIELTRRTEENLVNSLFLVGGFGESPYLQHKVAEYCKMSKIQFCCPDNSWSAVVKGASLRGLKGPTITNRKCRLHYGRPSGWVFRPGVDKESDSYISPWTNTKMADGYVTWPINKGQNISTNTEETHRVAYYRTAGHGLVWSMALYGSACDDVPDRHDHQDVTKVGEIEVNFNAVNLDLFASKISPQPGVGRVWEFDFELVWKLGKKHSVMEFEARSHGKTIGLTTINFKD